MSLNLKNNKFFLIISLILIIVWIYLGSINQSILGLIFNKSEIEDNQIDINDPKDLNFIFSIADKNKKIEPKLLKNNLLISSIISKDYKTNQSKYFIFQQFSKKPSINPDRKYQELLQYYTPQLTIGKILPNSTEQFISLAYNINSLSQKNIYLNSNNEMGKWEEKNNEFLKKINLEEFTNIINQIGSVSLNNEEIFYIRSRESYNTSSLLNNIILEKINDTVNIYKTIDFNLSSNYSTKIFKSSNHNYFINIENYFFFSDKLQLLKKIAVDYSKNLTLWENKAFKNIAKRKPLNSINNKESFLYLYRKIDSVDRENNSLIITYQASENKDSIATSYRTMKFKQNKEKTNDSISLNLKYNDTIKKKSRSSIDKKEHEVVYTISGHETFRRATIKLEKEINKLGYDYSKIKYNHIFLITKNGEKKLSWEESKKIYLDKKNPENGDYFILNKLE